jgi:hypothetical protein
MTNEFWDTYENNGDSVVNMGDNIEGEHLEALNVMCDFNEDGSICKGEFYMCLVMYENQWRADNCPGYPMLYCDAEYVDLEYEEGCHCPGLWTCDDIM